MIKQTKLPMTKETATTATKTRKFTAKRLMKVLTVVTVMSFMLAAFTVVSSAAAPPAATGGADAAYKTVIEFFITWLTRVGMLVGLIGAIMFALAIKNNDAEQKQAGLTTLVAGFVVAAVCGAADMFDLFT